MPTSSITAMTMTMTMPMTPRLPVRSLPANSKSRTTAGSPSSWRSWIVNTTGPHTETKTVVGGSTEGGGGKTSPSNPCPSTGAEPYLRHLQATQRQRQRHAAGRYDDATHLATPHADVGPAGLSTRLRRRRRRTLVSCTVHSLTDAPPVCTRLLLQARSRAHSLGHLPARTTRRRTRAKLLLQRRMGRVEGGWRGVGKLCATHLLLPRLGLGG